MIDQRWSKTPAATEGSYWEWSVTSFQWSSHRHTFASFHHDYFRQFDCHSIVMITSIVASSRRVPKLGEIWCQIRVDKYARIQSAGAYRFSSRCSTLPLLLERFLHFNLSELEAASAGWPLDQRPRYNLIIFSLWSLLEVMLLLCIVIMIFVIVVTVTLSGMKCHILLSS